MNESDRRHAQGLMSVVSLEVVHRPNTGTALKQNSRTVRVPSKDEHPLIPRAVNIHGCLIFGE
jgi:hypothetical protein